MSALPFVRAYLAGAAVPTVFLPLAYVGLNVLRQSYHLTFPIERVIVYPLACLPAVWGLWNMLFHALRGRGWLPLGLHGAILPVVIIPAAVLGFRALRIELPWDPKLVAAMLLPFLMFVYYLLWKYVVGWLNETLQIA